MGIQAAGARRIVETRPPDEAVTVAREALGNIELSSRTAVLELHRLLGMLRSGDSAGTSTDAATLADVPALAENARRAGLPVDVEVSGTPPAGGLAPTLDRSAYRIVQEALTNVLRHAGRGARATVTIRYEPSAVDLRIVDSGGSGGGAPSPAAGSGNGLIGMRERVALFGGSFQAGPRTAGGFEVHAVLPTDGRVAGMTSDSGR